VPNRLRALVKDGSKYGLVGVFGTLLDVIIFNLAFLVLKDQLDVSEPVSAKAISTLLSAGTTYFLHGFWTFRNRGGSRGDVFTISLFGLVTLAGLGISLGIVACSFYLLGFTSLLANNVANGVAIVASAVFRFVATRQLVFSTWRRGGLRDASK